MVTKSCEHCGKEFRYDERRVHLKKYCSTQCADKAKWRRYTKVHPSYQWRVERKCEHCGKPFLPKIKAQIYCSYDCAFNSSGQRFKLKNPEYYKAYHKKAAAQRKKPKPLNRKKYWCIACGRLIRNGNRQYCQTCHHALSKDLDHPDNVYRLANSLSLESLIEKAKYQ